MLKKTIPLIICLTLIPISASAVGTSGKASIVICSDTNQVLYGENYHEKMGMASTTKIMTAIIALENGNTSDLVTVSQNAAGQEGSSIYLKAGEKIPLEDLLYGLMLNSGNDAAMAIAEHIEGSADAFTEKMNEKALELGLSDTHFENPSGLPDENHYSTAYDMAIIMSYAMKNEEFAKIAGTKEHSIKTPEAVTYLRNHNKLLWQYPYTTGGKTGYTKSCGRCFVSAAQKDGVNLVAVTLDAPSDWQDHKHLLDFGFENAKITRIISENDIICTKKIQGERLNLLAEKDVFIPLKNGKKHHITCKVNLDEAVNGDIAYKTHLGTGDIFVGDFYVTTIDLVSGQSIYKRNTVFDVFGAVLKNTLLKK